MWSKEVLGALCKEDIAPAAADGPCSYGDSWRIVHEWRVQLRDTEDLHTLHSDPHSLSKQSGNPAASQLNCTLEPSTPSLGALG